MNEEIANNRWQRVNPNYSGIDCPGCSRPITANNAGGYRTLCKRCVRAFPSFPDDGEGHVIAGRYPDFSWD